MLCPKCGVDVAAESVFCQKCGERIDLPDEESAAYDQAATGPAPEDVSSAEGPRQPTARPDDRPLRTPADRFKENATARQTSDDDPEEELWQGRYAWKAMIGPWALSGLISVALVVLAILARNWAHSRYVTWFVVIAVVLLVIYQLCTMKYRQWHVRYWLTSQRFIHETGILRRVTDRIEVIDMDDITFEQTLLERFVGVGTIRITSSDRTHPELLLLGIENVKEVAEEIDDVRRSERRRRGLHIESI